MSNIKYWDRWIRCARCDGRGMLSISLDPKHCKTCPECRGAGIVRAA